MKSKKGDTRGVFKRRRVLMVLIACLFIVANMSTVVVRASGPEVQEQYAKAVDSVKKVIEMANSKNIKPLREKCENSLEPGKTDIKEISAALEAGFYKEIINAKKEVNVIPEDYAAYRNIFLSIISNYEDAIYDSLEDFIKESEKDTKKEHIIIGREISKYFEEEQRSYFSSKLDKLQEGVFNNGNKLVDRARNTKSEADIKEVENYIKEMKEIPQEFFSDEISKFIKQLEESLKRIRNMIKVDKIVNMEGIELQPREGDKNIVDKKTDEQNIEKEKSKKSESSKLSVTLPVPVPKEYDLYLTFQWINEVCKGSPTVETLKNSYAYTKVIGDDRTTVVDMPLVKTKDNREVPVQGQYLIYLVNKETGSVEFIGKNPISINLGIESSTSDDKNKSTLKINTPAKFSGYITHEIKAKYKNRYIKEDILIEAGDTEKKIAEKINDAFKEIPQTYIEKTTMKVKDSELTIETLESEEITHSVQ